MKYVAVTQLSFINESGLHTDPLEVCEAGETLELIPERELTLREEDSLERRRRMDPAVKILPFRWRGRMRLLEVGTDVKPVGDTPALVGGRGRPVGRRITR